MLTLFVEATGQVWRDVPHEARHWRVVEYLGQRLTLNQISIATNSHYSTVDFDRVAYAWRDDRGNEYRWSEFRQENSSKAPLVSWQIEPARRAGIANALPIRTGHSVAAVHVRCVRPYRKLPRDKMPLPLKLKRLPAHDVIDARL